MRRLLKFALAAFVVTSIPSAAFAQDIASQIALNEMLGANFENQAGIDRDDDQAEKPAKKDQAKPSPKSNPQKITLTYQVSLERRKANLNLFVENLKNIDPKAAADLQNTMASGDVIAEIGKGLKPVGLDYTNVADAYSFWIMGAWMAAIGVNWEVTPPQIAAVKKQSANALYELIEFGMAGDVEKQSMAESLMIQGAIIDGALQNPVFQSGQAKRDFQKAIMQQGLRMNVDLSAINLTDQGFVPRVKKK